MFSIKEARAVSAVQGILAEKLSLEILIGEHDVKALDAMNALQAVEKIQLQAEFAIAVVSQGFTPVLLVPVFEKLAHRRKGAVTVQEASPGCEERRAVMIENCVL